MSEMFSAATYAANRLPLSQASPLPGWCYSSPEWYAREMEALFKGPHSEWLCVGREDEVPNPGDFYTMTVAEEPLIIVRDQSNKVNVFSATCRHRGTIIAKGKGNCRAFVCPYHRWTYALDGGLTRTPGNPPPMEGAENFNMSDHGLIRIRTEYWRGFVFITFNPDPPPLLQSLGGLTVFAQNYNLEDMRCTHSETHEVECNWKVYLENSFENYHVPTVHRKHIDPDKPQNWVFEETDGRFEAMYSQRSVSLFAGLPTIPGLTEKQASGLFHVWSKPALQIVLTPSYIRSRHYLPEGPGKLRFIQKWAFPKATIDRPEFAEVVGPGFYDKQRVILGEDLAITPVVQQGMRASLYKPGRYSLEEFIVHKIANYTLDRVIGPAEPQKRAARTQLREVSA